MKKKIKALLLMLVCIFTLAACGNATVKPLVEDPHEAFDDQVRIVSYLISRGDAELGMLMYQFTGMAMTREDAARYTELTDDTLDTISGALSSIGIKVDSRVFFKGINSYADALELLGDNMLENPDMDENTTLIEAYPSENIEYDVRADEVVASYYFKTKVEGGHDGIVEIIFDKNLHITAITVNTVLGLGESMQRAGTNTLIGMGTVFIMLILIAIIISLLKYVPSLLDAFKAPAEGDTEASVDKAIAGIVEREEAQQSDEDDTELIAVIAAAIAAAGGGSASTDGFVVRSIRRIR